MKKIIFILSFFAFAISATAQTAEQNAAMDKKKTEMQLKNKIASKKDEKHEAGADLKHLKIAAAVKDRKEVRSDRRQMADGGCAGDRSGGGAGSGLADRAGQRYPRGACRAR